MEQKRRIIIDVRGKKNCLDSGYSLPVPMNGNGGYFSIPDNFVRKKDNTAKLEVVEKYLIEHISHNLKRYPYDNQFKNHILVDYCEEYFSDRIIYEEMPEPMGCWD